MLVMLNILPMVFINSVVLSKENQEVFINLNKVLYMVILVEYQLMVLLKVILMVLQ